MILHLYTSIYILVRLYLFLDIIISWQWFIFYFYATELFDYSNYISDIRLTLRTIFFFIWILSRIFFVIIFVWKQLCKCTSAVVYIRSTAAFSIEVRSWHVIHTFNFKPNKSIPIKTSWKQIKLHTIKSCKNKNVFHNELWLRWSKKTKITAEVNEICKCK